MRTGRPLPRRTRFVLAAAALLLAAGFVVARAVRPSDDGVGTHRQLGLPACGYLVWTGHPCPACGLTTSLSHLVRGEWAASVRTQPVGPVIGLVSAVAIGVCGYAAACGRWPLRWGPLATAVLAVWSINGLLLVRWMML